MKQQLIKIHGGSISWMDPTGEYEDRDDGPAIERPNGYLAWYRNGDIHRLDGPAVERCNGVVEYWLNGKRLSLTEWLARVKPVVFND